VEKAKSSTLFFINSGACSAVKIAKSSFTVEQIVQNILQSILIIVSKIPKKWNNIQSLHIKTKDSVALPIYNSLPEQFLKITSEFNSKQSSDEQEIDNEKEDESEDKEVAEKKRSKQ